MELNMNRVSAAYIGAIAISDIIHPSEHLSEFYNAKYQLTRARDDNGKPLAMNGESLVIHRKDNSNRREGFNTASIDLTMMTLEAWPIGEGIVGSVIESIVSQFVNSHKDRINEVTSWFGF